MEKIMSNDAHQSESDTQLSHLELDFPRIAEAVCKVWGTAEIEPYLQSLMIDKRSTRIGFPAEIVEELMLLDGQLWELSDTRKRFLNTPDDADFAFGR
jgi:hypothetical protein